MKVILTLVVLFVIINLGIMGYSSYKHDKLEQDFLESVVQIVTEAPEFDRGQGDNELYSINPIGQFMPGPHCDVVCEPLLFLEQRTCVGLEICMCDYIDLNTLSTYENCSWAELISK